MELAYPKGFSANGWHIGLKPDPKKLDFGVLHSYAPCHGFALFTRNHFTGWPVQVGREHSVQSRLRTVIVNSGNANTATGAEGLQLVRKCCQLTAQSLKVSVEEVLPASTGIIGQSLESQRNLMFQACRSIPEKLKKPNFSDFAHSICTTDAYPKAKSLKLENGLCITGIAKGAGMIQPNMATMLAFLCTDAQIEAQDLKLILEALTNRSFNRITVDSDTSTNDTVALLANGRSGVRISFNPEMAREFEKLSYPISIKDLSAISILDKDTCSFLLALLDICVTLACMIVRDGEGSTKLVELRIKKARDRKQALKIGRSILNSPLCKTALYGCDPNWGRLCMAIGKVFDEPIDRKKLKIYLGEHCLFPDRGGKKNLDAIARYMKNEKLQIRVVLGEGEACETLWGCDLNENYVRLNSLYTR